MDKKKINELIKKIRKDTNLGILDCSNALKKANYDIKKALKFLYEQGKIKILKTANRTTSEGMVYSIKNDSKIVIIELLCETDFVAINDKFSELGKMICNKILSSEYENNSNIEEIKKINFDTKTTIQSKIDSMSIIFGEKIVFSKCKIFNILKDEIGIIYNHNNKIISGIIAKKIDHDNLNEILENLAMHICASNPRYTHKNEVEKNIINNYVESIKKSIENSTTKDYKPQILEKIIEGKLNNILKEEVLDMQILLTDNKTLIKNLLKENNIIIKKIIRIQLADNNK